jgi:pyruvate,orthophosphate dikinase
MSQIETALIGIYRTWARPRLLTFSEREGAHVQKPIAVSIQSMVFGNIDGSCGSGVAWEIKEDDTENAKNGFFIFGAQGRGIMSNGSTAILLKDVEKNNSNINRQISQIRKTIKDHYNSDYSFDFTIERGKVYVLRTRAKNVEEMSDREISPFRRAISDKTSASSSINRLINAIHNDPPNTQSAGSPSRAA